MNVERAIRARRMTRAFSNDPLSPETVMSLLDLARRAPSAGNTQATHFLVLNTPATIDLYWQTTLTASARKTFRWQQLLTAPTLVILTVEPEAYVRRYAESDKARPGLGQDTQGWPVPFWWVDAGAVAQNLLLLATSSGLGACLFGLFQHEDAVKQAFNIPPDQRAVATIALGHPLADNPGRSANRPRPPITDITHFGHWPSPDAG